MSNPSIPELPSETPDFDDPGAASRENQESFGDLLSQYEQRHARPAGGDRQVAGTVIAVSGEQVFLDVGFKIEGVLPLSIFTSAGEAVKSGDTFPVTIKGRNEEGYYELSRLKVSQPTDWPSLERAFAEKATIVGTVTGVIKGGLNVDVGVRAFMPASRSGTHDAAEMEKLVGQEIRCRILKLEVTEEDVVVDRRAVIEEEERAVKEHRYTELKEGDTVTGEVRTLMDYGAFVDIGGVDGLLHVGDIAWGRVNKPEDVLSVGQQIEARILKIDPEKRRISLGLKQLQPHPWDHAAGKYKSGERVRGVVTRVAEFGAFVELEPGIEGLIHLSEMSWAKKVRKPSDMVKPGDAVEAVILNFSPGEHRIALGLKQALGDPWADAPQRFPAGSVIEGPVTSFTKFGAFVQLSDGVEGMIHISEISAEKHIHHPQDVLKLGQAVKAQVLEVDPAKRQLRLSIKKLVPVSLDEYMAEHKQGDVVTGRLMEISGATARVELGEGIQAVCELPEKPVEEASPGIPKVDLSALSSMLQSRWKTSSQSGPSQSTSGAAAKPEAPKAGQIRSFRLTRLDPAAKAIEVALV